MRIIDITRELLSAPVYPGDPAPRLTVLQNMENGDDNNLSALSMCVHNGTHMDAPRHFLPEGETIEEIPADVFCGTCLVVVCNGLLLGDAAERLVAKRPPERLLFKGEMSIHPSAAFVLSDSGIKLIGVEPQSVAAPADTGAVHRQLLGGGIVLLEGLDLLKVTPGEYTLFALPLKIVGAEGAPVRAVLVDNSAQYAGGVELEAGFMRR